MTDRSERARQLATDSTVARLSRQFIEHVLAEVYVTEIRPLETMLEASQIQAEARTVSPPVDAPFDLVAHLHRQREFSRRTFGPGARTAGVLDHIRKELAEIEADPADISEWVDVVILAFDGAWRAGWEPEAIVAAIVAKQTKNEGRTWPDWRTVPTDKAIEHDRSGEARAVSPPVDAETGDLVDRLRLEMSAGEFMRVGDMVQKLVAERKEAADTIERLTREKAAAGELYAREAHAKMVLAERLSAAEAARDEAVRALASLIQMLDDCPRRERGVGGMTIDAQIRRTMIHDVPAIAVEDAREILYAIRATPAQEGGE